MKCSWFIRSLRLAVLGGVGIACSLTGARLGNAAVVGADVPSWMASLRTLNLYDYRTTWEGDSWEQPSPWLDPDEGYSYGGYYEASEYRPYAEESTATETPAYGESTSGDYNYDYGYRYGYQNESAATTDEGETYAGDESDYSGNYAESMNDESATVTDEGETYAGDESDYSGNYAESMNDESATESEAGYDAPMYGEHGEYGQTETAETETSYGEEANPYHYEAYQAPQSETEAASQTEPSDDYSYRYEYSYARDKYGYWAGTSEDNDDATDNSMEAGGESTDTEDEASYESDESTSEANQEMSQEWRPSDYGDKYDFSTDGDAADAMNDESDETSTDDSMAYDDAEESYEATSDESQSYDYRHGMSYGNEGMQAYESGNVEESYSDENEADDTSDDEARWETGPQTYICGSLAESYEPASWTGKFAEESCRPADFSDWRADELLTDSDRDVLRQLGHLYEESQEVRRTMLNDYIETLGWEALKLAERFEDSSNVEFLGFSEDLPSLAALLATFRRLERDELTMDQAVDLLCHNVGYLPEQWIDTVDTIVTQDEVDSFQGTSRTPVRGAGAAACEAMGLWLEQSWDNTTVAFRNIARQIADMGVWALTASVPAQQAAVEADYPWYYDTF